MLIKTIFENGDLESSQKRSGVPEGTARVSVAARDLSFLTEIFGEGVADAKKPQNVGLKRKTRASISRRPALTFWRFFRRKN